MEKGVKIAAEFLIPVRFSSSQIIEEKEGC
jgi:hypothetical protein